MTLNKINAGIIWGSVYEVNTLPARNRQGKQLVIHQPNG
ncbi:hypothetical protein EDC52_101334 [Biostraticola tofi]|uniref:Uncharacterized protein n=1 Tax=Biostraticola tofi TaxID=466109 RepID=A0A4R3Z4A0_9GAMM|nr:hypothetical protein EDC52_101334 [Biostraticola tofi]